MLASDGKACNASGENPVAKPARDIKGVNKMTIGSSRVREL